MSSAPLTSKSPATGIPAAPPEWRHPVATRLHHPLFVLFLLAIAGQLIRLFLQLEPPPSWQWVDAAFWALTAATLLMGLARRLPVQNVAVVGTFVGIVAGGLEWLSATTGLPFGSRRFLDDFGPRAFGLVPWAMPALWITVVVASRGVARLIVRPYRKTTYYGFWVIGLAALLAVAFDVSLEPFAVHLARWWLWDAPARALTWQTAPLASLLGWLATTLLILCFATPWLLNKQPVKQPTDYHPLAIWLALQLVFLTGNALHGRWSAVAATVVLSTVIATAAVRGAR